MHVLPSQPLHIKRVSGLTHEEFNDLYRNKKPVIITDLATNWKFLEGMNSENGSLKTLFQNSLLKTEKVFLSQDNLHFLGQDILQVEMNLETVIDRILLPSQNDSTNTDFNQRIYLRSTIYDDIKAEMNFPDYLLDDGELFSQTLSGLWWSSSGNITPLHIDLWHGILVQLMGVKSVVLFNPEDTPYLYQNSNALSNHHTCRINLLEANSNQFKDKFPNFEVTSSLLEATPYHALLSPSESLYIPPCWWHDVISLDPCISTTLRWDIGMKENIHSCALK